ncbi:Phosphopantetheine attachment site, partial [Paraburkholderia steynii]
LIYLGRNDNQIKIRGFRIEPGEIEKCLTEHPDVASAVIVAKGESSEKYLVAYVAVRSQPEGGDGEAFRSHLKEALQTELCDKLPGYMVPSVFMLVESLPTSTNGKLDHKSLPEPTPPVSASMLRAADQNETELTIAELWGDVLGVSLVGRDDTFFELGGHSLRAIQMLGRIRSTFGVAPSLGILFSKPKLRDFSAELTKLLKESNDARIPSIEVVTRSDLLPVSFSQQRLWFLSQDEDVSSSYNIPVAIRLVGALSTDALRKSFNALMQRHESLRTVFALIGGHLHARLLPIDVRLTLLEEDLYTRSDGSEALGTLLREESLRPFDLTSGPLIRACLIRTAPDEHVLLFTVHHIISDRWSAGILLNELSAFYTAFVRGSPSSLSPLEIQYPDYASWQRTWFNDN